MNYPLPHPTTVRLPHPTTVRLPHPTTVSTVLLVPGRHAGRREDRERAGASPQRANSCRPHAGLG
jgi:hypothetical protein